MDTLVNPFDDYIPSQYTGATPEPVENPFDSYEDKEPDTLAQNLARTYMQFPLGLAEATAPGLVAGGIHALGMGEANDPEEIEHIRKISEREGIPFDEEKYLEAANTAANTFPIVSNIAHGIEKLTGLPLEPKEWYQKALRLSSMVGGAAPGGAVQKVASGAIASGASQAMQALGVPEQFSDLLGMALGGYGGTKVKSEFTLTGKSPKQKAESLAKGIYPGEVMESRFNTIRDEVVPHLQQLGRENLVKAEQSAIKASKDKYANELANVRAKHENDIRARGTDTEQQAIERDYQNKLRNLQAEHEADLYKIETENKANLSEYDQKMKEYEASIEAERKAAQAKPVEPEQVSEGSAPGLEKTGANAIDNELGQVFSDERFVNSTEGGKALKNEIAINDEEVYRGVNEMYKESREELGKIDEIHPQLASKLETRIKNLEKIPEPSTIQARVIKGAKNILNDIATIEEGAITGYKEINSQVLQEQIQSLRQIIDTDFAHGDAKNIFKPLIDDIQDAVIESAKQAGSPKAAESLSNARAAYRTWAEAFDNDYVRPFRDLSNHDYAKLYRTAQDFDEINMLRRVLDLSENGTKYSSALQRKIVDKHVSKFLDNPSKADPRAFNDALKELESVASKEQLDQVRNIFNRERARPSPDLAGIKKPSKPEGKKLPERPRIPAPPKPTSEFVTIPKYNKPKPTPEMNRAAKLAEIAPEEVESMMGSRSGIQELRRDLSKTPEAKAAFDKMLDQKSKSILQEELVEADFSGDKLYNVLNKEKNKEIFTEIYGEAEAEAMRQEAKAIGKKQVKTELRKKRLTGIGKKFILYKVLTGIHGII